MAVTYENNRKKEKNPVKVVMWENVWRVVRCKKPWGGKITFSCTLLGSAAGALQIKDINIGK